jgi:hypothetical protein
MSETVTGADNAALRFLALGTAAQAELKTTLEKVGAGVLALQQGLAPVLTGRLRTALTVNEEVERLRVRVGIFGKLAQSKSTVRKYRKAGRDPAGAANHGSLFYAIIQESGRRAQTVTVTRGTTASPGSSASRRKHNQTLRKPFTMRVPAMAGRHFIHVEDRIGAVAERYLARFWDETLKRAGEVSS